MKRRAMIIDIHEMSDLYSQRNDLVGKHGYFDLDGRGRDNFPSGRFYFDNPITEGGLEYPQWSSMYIKVKYLDGRP